MSLTSFNEESFFTALANLPRPFRRVEDLGVAMQRLREARQDDLPLPGSGHTLARWRALAAVGACDLSLAKIYEGHTDAVAILAELGGDQPEGLGAVWAAEPPQARVMFAGGTLSGRKLWCSGAAVVGYALVSAWTESGEPILVRVALDQPGVEIENGGWNAVGMAASQSVAVIFRQAEAVAVGAPGAYVARPGFWQGGAGIAAVWYGGAVAIGQTLASSRKLDENAHAAAHLGAVDSALRGTKALLVETAAWMDANPAADASAPALRLRASVEMTANEVLLRTGRALGPGPLCGDALHAQRCADLPVFLRQSHAEHDLAALGRSLAGDWSAWKL